jgi:hypothetical protein
MSSGGELISSFQRDLRFSDWVQNRGPPYLSTNAGAPEIAFQDWLRFKEAFAPELVARAVKETAGDLGRPITRCSDPFGGSGTTALACQFLGIKPSTIELNPFLADLIEAKLSRYEADELERTFGEVICRATELSDDVKDDPFPNSPKTFVEPGEHAKFIFSRPIAVRIAGYRKAIDELESSRARRFFRVMLASIVVGVSNVIVSGKGRRYRQRWQGRQSDPSTVDISFNNACLRAIYQVRRHSNRPTFEYHILRGDSRSMVQNLGHHELSVFSPPYPNSFDYTDVYNVELWTLGYLRSADDNRKLREQTLRSHVQINRPFSAQPSGSLSLEQTIDRLESVRPWLWDPHIPEMIGAYFDDMRTVLLGLRRQITTGGRVYVVVGDSCYAGVDVPVARVLGEEAPSLGFTPIAVEPFRSMRASPQQGGRPELAENLLTLRAT